MKTMQKKTTLRQNVGPTDRQWFIVDASQYTLGALSVAIANVLRGRHRVDFTPHVDGGDYVVVINAAQVKVTGNKEDTKVYYRHSGYVGHLKTATLSEVRAKNPARILENAVGGMLPKTKLRASQLKRLRLILGPDHTFQAQQPKPLPFN